jgi:hypothetical protein
MKPMDFGKLGVAINTLDSETIPIQIPWILAVRGTDNRCFFFEGAE